MENYLVVNILAENTNENIRKFSKLAKSSQCNVIDCHFKVMGQYLSAIFLFSGSWNAIAKMENMLAKLENECNIIIQKRDDYFNIIFFYPITRTNTGHSEQMQ